MNFISVKSKKRFLSKMNFILLRPEFSGLNFSEMTMFVLRDIYHLPGFYGNDLAVGVGKDLHDRVPHFL